MSIDELEKKIQTNEIAIKKLSIDIDNIRRHNDELFADLNVTPQQISAFISNKDHFTPENWESLHHQKKQLDEKLTRELANIRNPGTIKKNQNDRANAHQWLFVR